MFAPGRKAVSRKPTSTATARLRSTASTTTTRDTGGGGTVRRARRGDVGPRDPRAMTVYEAGAAATAARTRAAEVTDRLLAAPEDTPIARARALRALLDGASPDDRRALRAALRGEQPTDESAPDPDVEFSPDWR
jgi:hypothetical protein